MKIKVSEATPLQLDWLVQEALLKSLPQPELGLLIHRIGYGKKVPAYSTDPAQGQPILEREFIATFPVVDMSDRRSWGAGWDDGRQIHRAYANGPTMLIAGLRCYVTSKLGDVVDVPDSL